jgi:hypothetical protein
VMAAHLYLPLPPLPADVPAELDVLVDRLTTKDPARRISDARELAGLAARLRDSIGDGALVPPARTAAQSGLGAAVPSPVPRAAALAADPGSGWAGGNGQADPYHTGSTGNTALLAAADAFAGRAYASDEWNVPPRMSLPTGPPGQGPPGPQRGNQRRRGGAAVAVGAAVVASAGLVALLVSGAFSGSPTANQAPAGSSTAGTSSTGLTPSHSASGAARASGPAGGAAGPSTVATPAATSPKVTPGGKKPSASPSARPSTSSTPSGGGSGTPSGGTSSGSPATGPSGTPGTSSSGSPAPSPTSCFLGICV